MENLKNKRRIYGEHLTPINVFKDYILPEIKDKLYDYRWVDLFCGEGNLILPILELIPTDKRVEFFKEHIFLFDIQEEMVEKSIFNATKYGIPEDVARQNIIQRDTIKNYPTFILDSDLPVYHITNPPYLYIGYIAKHKETQKYLDYFKDENKGYQDLYQLALMNDLRHGIKNMVYIIPSNFLFGFSVFNKIRNDFLPYYNIKKAFIFEKKIFDFTGTNVGIFFFERKDTPEKERIKFEGVKVGKDASKKVYILDPENNFRIRNEFEEFVKRFKAPEPLGVFYYGLTTDDVEKYKGDKELKVIDVNDFNGKEYAKKSVFVDEIVYEKVKSNILFIRTIDTGSYDGRAGLYVINEVFGVDGILVSKSPHRTHPIQIFFSPNLPPEYQLILKDYFNLLIEYFREKTDSEFMTTYRYSSSDYTRKYLGLLQARALIETFPILSLTEEQFKELASIIEKKDAEELIAYLQHIHNRLDIPPSTPYNYTTTEET